MIKSQLVLRIAEMNPHLYQRDVETLVNAILEEITDALRRGDRVELRGFGAFSVKRRDARAGRNPRTGERVDVGEKAVAQFRAGKEMRQRLNLDGEASDGDEAGEAAPPRRGKAARASASSGDGGGPAAPPRRGRTVGASGHGGEASDVQARGASSRSLGAVNSAEAPDARGRAASGPVPLGDATES